MNSKTNVIGMTSMKLRLNVVGQSFTYELNKLLRPEWSPAPSVCRPLAHGRAASIVGPTYHSSARQTRLSGNRQTNEQTNRQTGGHRHRVKPSFWGWGLTSGTYSKLDFLLRFINSDNLICSLFVDNASTKIAV